MRGSIVGRGRGLSARSALVLRLISDGRTYEQILSIHPELTYLDIFSAAREALDLAGAPTGGSPELRERRGGYGGWSAAEDAELAHLVAGGEGVAEMAARLRRNPEAVRARVMQLNLAEDGVPP